MSTNESSPAYEVSLDTPDEVNTTALPKQPDGPKRIRFFTDRIDWMGPVIVVLSSWYFAAQVLVAWVFRPQYSFVSNAISDLGNTACPPLHSGICSPLNWVMNASIGLLGLAMMVGAMLIYTEFSFPKKDGRERAAAIAGFACMLLGGLGAILVGAVPENVNTAHLHTVGTAMAIGFGQLAILILGLALDIDDWLREFMLVTSLLVLLAGISIAGKHQFGIGGGALERLAQYPESVWLILFGFYISRNHSRDEVVGSRFMFKHPSPWREAGQDAGAAARGLS